MKSFLDSAPFFAALVALTVTATGCSPDFERIDFMAQTTPPTAVTIRYESIAIPQGIAIGVEAVPIAGGDPMDEDTAVELRSDDPDVLGCDPSLDERVFIVYGVNHGITQVSVIVDGQRVGSIPAVVSPP